MSMLDSLHTFSDSQALSGAGPDGALLTKCSKTIDLVQRRDIASMSHLAVEFTVTEAFVAAGVTGTPRMQFGISMGDDDVAVPLNLTTLVLTGGAGLTTYMVAANLPLNARVVVPLPIPSVPVGGLAGFSGGMPANVQRYLMVSYWNTAFSASYFSAGKITARLILAPRNQKLIYPNTEPA